MGLSQPDLPDANLPQLPRALKGPGQHLKDKLTGGEWVEEELEGTIRAHLSRAPFKTSAFARWPAANERMSEYIDTWEGGCVGRAGTDTCGFHNVCFPCFSTLAEPSSPYALQPQTPSHGPITVLLPQPCLRPTTHKLLAKQCWVSDLCLHHLCSMPCCPRDSDDVPITQ